MTDPPQSPTRDPRDHADSHEQLVLDTNAFAARLSEFVGQAHAEGGADAGRAGGAGQLVGDIYRANPGAAVATLRRLKDAACLLTGRAVALGPSPTSGGPPVEAGGQDAQHASGSGGARADRGGKRRKRGADSRPVSACPIRARIDGLLETIYYLEISLRCAEVSHRLLPRVLGDIDMQQGQGQGQGQIGGGAPMVTDEDLAKGVERFTPVNVDEGNRFQNLLLYLFNTAQDGGLRRQGDDCYRKIITDDGHDTHAWERVGSIREFVYGATRKETNFQQWLNLTSGGGVASMAADHIAQANDSQFPTLERDRHVFAFSNGLYLAERDAFLRYGTAAHAGVGDDVVACKYFDAPFDDFEGVDDWYAIPTPNLQRILDHQEFGEEVGRWMYVFIGRLIYSVNELDQWQVVPYLKGTAGTGKSSVLVKVCRNLYDARDVGVLSNNIERQFGLSAFADKFLFIAPEVKHDMRLEQGDFQSLVSGETVQVAVKHKTAYTADWKVPGIMAGNELPGWRDNSGSINRRIVLFDFVNRVEKGDMELGNRLVAELPTLVKKCNAAYLDAVRLCGRDDLWAHLPEYFQDTRKAAAVDTNPLVNFMENGARLRRDPEGYLPYSAFVSDFNEFCRLNNLGQSQLDQKAVVAALKAYLPDKHVFSAIRVAKGTAPNGGAHLGKQKYIIGVAYVGPGQGQGQGQVDDPLA